MDTINIVSIIVPTVACIYLFWRRGTDAASVESNTILRGLIEDQKAEIVLLRERSHKMGNEIQILKLQVQQISDKREYLEKLVSIALLEHFSNKPEVVATVKQMIKENEKGGDKT